ncbi:squalene synthetase-like protein [Batrachochytrium dendrobatidis]
MNTDDLFLNVQYGTLTAEINITEAERLGDVQDVIKAKYGEIIPTPAVLIQLYDQQGQLIADLDDIPPEKTPQYYQELAKGGSCVVIGCLPSPTREPSKSTIFDAGSTSLSTANHQDFSPKRQRTEPNALTTQFKSFANAQLVDECIQSTDHVFFPYTQDKIQKLYVRECYHDVFGLLLDQIDRGMKSFAISGTSGIGKSLFFVYILHRLMDDFTTKTLSLKPNRIVYQVGSSYKCFDLQQQFVARTTEFDAEELVWKQDTFYVIDGRTSEPLISSCIVLFISSPRSEWYKEFVKQKMAKEWDFPVWTLNELQACRRHCYPDVPIETINERYRMYGGVARSVFDIVSNPMEEALADVDAVKGVRNIGFTIKLSANTHTLLHTIVSDDGQYEFLHVDIASRYIGEQLWQRHSSQMITNIQQMFDGIPTKISRHLFEIYGHMVFCTGGQTLKCRCLEDGKATKITLDALNGQRITFGIDTIPTAAALDGNYYEPTDDDDFAAIDSLSRQGMFQFTVAAEHPICGVDILTKLCNLYDEPKLYFVVPPHQFKGFKKQSFKPIDGTEQIQPIHGLKQYVIQLPLIQPDLKSRK